MNKFTREQTNWFIEKLDMYHVHTDCSLTCEACEIKYGEVKRVIEQCTEREFPGLNINVMNDSQININEWKKDLLFLNVPGEYAYLNKAQFKQFAEGINKIVEWLEEQE